MNTQLRQNAAIQFKNFIESNWKFTENGEYNKSLVFNDSPEDIIPVSANEKEVIRQNIIGIMGDCEEKAILQQYIPAVKKILKLDFETSFPNCVKSIKDLLESKNESRIYAGLCVFYQLCKIYEFETNKKRGKFLEIFNEVFPVLLLFADDLKDKLTNEVAIIVLQKILKIIYKVIQTDIPALLIEERNFDKILIVVFSVMNLENPNMMAFPKNTQEINQLNNSEFWKLMLVSFQICYKVVQKYGNEAICDIDYLIPFCKRLNEKYTLEILKAMIHALYKTNSMYFIDQAICFMFKYLSLLMSKNSHIREISEQLDKIMKEFLIPNVVLSPKDLDQRYEDQKAYIYRQFDLSISFYDKRYAACQFVRACCEYRKYDKETKKFQSPEFFNVIFDYLTWLLETYQREKAENKQPNYLVKEALLNILESISASLNENAKDKLEGLITKYVVDELSASNGILVEKACLVIKTYSGLNYQNSQLLEHIVKTMCDLLAHQDLSVRILAAISLPSLMHKEKVSGILSGYVKQMLEVYLNLMNQIDLEELLLGLESIIQNFGENVADYAVDLSKELVRQFNRLIKSNIEEDDGEGQMAAEGVITAIQRIVTICISKDNIINQLEEIVSPLIGYGLTTDGFEFLDDTLDLIKILLRRPKVSASLWSFFTKINFCIIGDEEENKIVKEKYPDSALMGIGYENLDELFHVLMLFIVKDGGTLITSSDEYGVLYISRLLQTVNQVIENTTNNADIPNLITASKILIVLLDTLKGKIDAFLKIFLDFAMQKLFTVKNASFRNILLQVVASAMIYNPGLTKEYLNQKDPSLLEKTISLFLACVDKMKSEVEISKSLMGLASVILVLDLNSNEQLATSIFKKLVFLCLRMSKVYARNKNISKIENSDLTSDEKLDNYLKAVHLLI